MVKAYRCSRTHTSSARSASAVVIVEGVNRTSGPRRKRSRRSSSYVARKPAAARVFLATMGTVAAHTARATFASNLLAAGGVAVDVAGATESADDLLAAYDGQAVVCLAGSDGAYDAWGAEAVRALREAGASWVVIAGKPAMTPTTRARWAWTRWRSWPGPGSKLA